MEENRKKKKKGIEDGVQRGVRTFVKEAQLWATCTAQWKHMRRDKKNVLIF